MAVACSDGAVRLLDTSPQRAASVVRTSYAHGVEATAVAISREGGEVGRKIENEKGILVELINFDQFWMKHWNSPKIWCSRIYEMNLIKNVLLN